MGTTLDHSSSPGSSPSFHPEVVDRALLQATVEGRIGRIVGGRYTVTRLLGVGGMAAVYEAVQRDGQHVALKVLHPAHGRLLSRRKRFLREAYLANAIGHPNVVQMFADGVDEDGSVFLVMELLQGETVRALQQRLGGRLEPHLALRVADEVLDVLAVAHAMGIVHRDIKPANLFVTHEGRVKVLDFGIAHMRHAVPGMTLRTLPGAVLGTPKFMAPEQLLGYAEVDARSDLFALGATLFAMLTGEPVRAARAYAPGLQRTTIFAARPLRSAWPEASTRLAEAVDRALRFEPDERWPDARCMQGALRAARSRAVRLGATTLTWPARLPERLQGRVLGTQGAAAREPRWILRRAHAAWIALALAATAVAATAAMLVREPAGPEAARPVVVAPRAVPKPAAKAAAPSAVQTQPALVPAAADPARAVPPARARPRTRPARATPEPAERTAPAARGKRAARAPAFDVGPINEIVDPWE